MSEPPGRWSDYLYPPKPGQVGEVLRNKLGLSDGGQLDEAERRLTFLRAQQLVQEPGLVVRTFTLEHWRAIHRQLFQDVYSWAGELRTVDMGAEEHGFVPAAQLRPFADLILSQVRTAGVFAGRDHAGVVDGLANTLQALNIIHPFRDGNGRTQRILVGHIAERAGFRVEWHRIGRDEQHLMMRLAYEGDLDLLRAALEGAVVSG